MLDGDDGGCEPVVGGWDVACVLAGWICFGMDERMLLVVLLVIW